MCGIVGAVSHPQHRPHPRRRACSGSSTAAMTPAAWPCTGRRPAARAQHRPRGRAADAGRPPKASRAAPASPTPAGPRTARRRCTTPTRTSATGPASTPPSARAASRWCTTASSRTTTSCAPRCKARGYDFASQTDTEVIAHLVDSLYDGDLFDAVQGRAGAPARRLRDRRVLPDEPQRVVGARAGSPLILGVGKRGRRELPGQRRDGAGRRHRPDRLPGRGRRGRPAAGQVLDRRRATARPLDRAPVRTVQAHSGAAELGPYRHYMQKEIFEQPRAIADTLEGVQASCPSCSATAPTGLQGDRLGADPGLRHQLLQRLHRQVLAGVHRQDPDPGGDRQRVPLPRQRAQPAHAGGHHQPVAARPPTRWPRCATRAAWACRTR